MNYSELIQAYFERSTALQWYWTIYVIVIAVLLLRPAGLFGKSLA